MLLLHWVLYACCTVTVSIRCRCASPLTPFLAFLLLICHGMTQVACQ